MNPSYMLMRVALKLQTDCQKVWTIRMIHNLISFCICSILPQMYHIFPFVSCPDATALSLLDQRSARTSRVVGSRINYVAIGIILGVRAQQQQFVAGAPPVPFRRARGVS